MIIGLQMYPLNFSMTRASQEIFSSRFITLSFTWSNVSLLGMDNGANRSWSKSSRLGGKNIQEKSPDKDVESEGMHGDTVL